jgi:hypothetical protein
MLYPQGSQNAGTQRIQITTRSAQIWRVARAYPVVSGLFAGSADIRGNKSDCNAKFVATPHGRGMALVEYPTQWIHWKLGRTRKLIRKKLSFNIQAPNIIGGSQGMCAKERRNSTFLYTTMECNQKLSRGRLRRMSNRCFFGQTSSFRSRGRNRKNKTYNSSRANGRSQQICWWRGCI